VPAGAFKGPWPLFFFLFVFFVLFVFFLYVNVHGGGAAVVFAAAEWGSFWLNPTGRALMR